MRIRKFNESIDNNSVIDDDFEFYFKYCIRL